MDCEPTRFTFRADQRLKTQTDFRRALRGKRRVLGPLMISAVTGATPKTRIGIRISRRVGNAAKRNRIKRLLREWFRHHQHQIAGPIDLVITVNPHQTMSLEAYTALLRILVR